MTGVRLCRSLTVHWADVDAPADCVADRTSSAVKPSPRFVGDEDEK
jgi:hypothetical protein